MSGSDLSMITLSPQTIFGVNSSTTSFVPEQSYKMLLENFGSPDNPNPITPAAVASLNLRPDDIIGQYMDRELVLVSSAVTAAVVNDRASILTDVVFPKVETLETSFSISSLDPNYVPWSRVTNFGIPREVSHTKFQEAYTTARKKQMARIELNFLLDPNYGPQYIRLILSQLSQNAKLTLTLEAILQATEQPYRNMFYRVYEKNTFDHNRLFNEERANFGIANKDQGLFFRDMTKFAQGQFEFAFDTILAPQGTFARLIDGVAQRGAQLKSERAEYNPETRRIQSALSPSPSRSTASIAYGGRQIELIEVPTLQTNTRDTTEKIHRPFVTTTTVAEVLPLDAGMPNQPVRSTISSSLDIYGYSMTQTGGRHEHIQYIEALRNCFLYDQVTGEPSVHYRGFHNFMNTSIKGKRIPSPGESEEWRNSRSADDENDFGTDKYQESAVANKKNLIDMAFRDQPFQLTFDPALTQYRIPLHLGDFHDKQLRTERIQRAAKAAMLLPRGTLSSTALDELVTFIVNIRRQQYTEKYLEALIASNTPFQTAAGSFYVGSEHRFTDDRVRQWVANSYHCLRLPSYPNYLKADVDFPAGFHSWSGLQTIAHWPGVEANAAGMVGAARRHVNTLEDLYRLIKEVAPESELVDGSNTNPWVHGDDGGRSTLLDFLVQMKTNLDPAGPVFIDGGESGFDEVKDKKYVSIAVADGEEDAMVKAITDAIGAGSGLDQWLELGSHYPIEAIPNVRKIATFLTELGKSDKSVTVKNQNGEDSSLPMARIASALSDLIRTSLAGKSIASNAIFLEKCALLLGEKDGKTAVDMATDFSKVYGQIGALAEEAASSTLKSAANKKTVVKPMFNEQDRIKGLKAAKKDPDADPNKNLFKGPRRTPLLESLVGYPREIRAILFIGDPDKKYRTVKSWDNVPDVAILKVSSSFSNVSESVIANAFGFKNQAPSDFASSSSSSQESRDFGSRQSRSMSERLQGAMYGMVDRDVMDWETSTVGDSSVSTPPGVVAGPGGRFFFGPWGKRFKYVKANIPDLLERVLTMSFLYARNNLFTHIAAANIGIGFMRFDLWRTGITTETAALVRMIRGTKTAFSAVSRISVRPTVEGVVGDVAITGEMFHGIVFADRRNIDMKPASMLLQHMHGRTVDFMTDPAQMTGDPAAVPAIFALCDSAENYRREYPAHMFNDNIYYTANRNQLTPFRKHGSGRWAAYLLGAEAHGMSMAERQRYSYWGNNPRSFCGDLSTIYKYGESSGRFDVIREGSNGCGVPEFCYGDAWKAFNGGVTSGGRNQMPQYVS